MPPSAHSFRQVMSAFATGVTIVTTRSGDTVHGLTANAFCSVSLEPMMVLVCVDKQTFSHDLIVAGRNFAVNILAADQQYLAERFSNNDLEAKKRYEGVAYRTATTGAPLLEGTLAWLDCELAAVHEGGDHTIFVGKIVAMGKGEGRSPLLYFQSRYHSL
jgi:flavin reductase (DIM6/NTAB) family NADH-FMN oxidoreductase RutF